MSALPSPPPRRWGDIELYNCRSFVREMLGQLLEASARVGRVAPAHTCQPPRVASLAWPLLVGHSGPQQPPGAGRASRESAARMTGMCREACFPAQASASLDAVFDNVFRFVVLERETHGTARPNGVPVLAPVWCT